MFMLGGHNWPELCVTPYSNICIYLADDDQQKQEDEDKDKDEQQKADWITIATM